jgi:citrate synthase
MRNLLTANQVALRLGVQVATIYAYVSRGVLTRTLAADGRTSRFDPGEIDQLARRGRPRVGTTQRGGVDVSLATAITHIQPDRLAYRGHDAATLAAGASFERVAELLWTGELPARASWQPAAPATRVTRRLCEALPAEASPFTRFAAVTAALAPLYPLRDDLRAPAVLTHARVLATTLVTSLPLQQVFPVEPAALAARLWPRVSPLAPRADRTHLLDAAATSAEPALARALAAGHIPGFGHPVYRGEDPRATTLLALLRAQAARREVATIDALLAAATTVSGEQPNIDIALAALAFAMKMPVGATEAIFGIARLAGWIAHALEEYGEQPLRFRARAIYTGR